jgi:flagellar hook-associated protein 2
MSVDWSSLISANESSSSTTGKLDVQYIVETIIASKQEPIKDLQAKETTLNEKKTAYQQLNTLAAGVESSLYKIKSAGFSSYSATSSNEDLLTVSSASTASAGDYSITVGQLARAQSNTSTGYLSSSDAVLAEGTTFTITQGDAEKTINISGNTRTLSGLRDAINNLGLDMSASVLYTGSVYKLQISSDETGTENQFTIDDTSGGAVGTSMSTATQTALDAEIYVNTAVADEYKITRSSNSINDVITGVTLNLNDASTSKTVKVSVDTDTTALRENIESFVTAFNAAVDYLNTQFTYDSSTGTSGILSGDSTARKVQQDLLSMVTAQVEGLTGDDKKYNSLAIIGMTINESGELEIDDETLGDALTNHLAAVKRIFVDSGTTTSSTLGYVGKGGSTVAGTYAVNVTQIAEKASVTGGAEVSGSGISQDETLTISYGGSDYLVSLTSGMTLNQVVSAINENMKENDLALTAAAVGNNLQISSEACGSAQTISVVSNVAASGGGTGIGTTILSDTGVDVAGTIGGAAATGNGQLLTSTAGDANGMMVLVNTTMLGDQGSVTVSFGIGEQLRQQMFEISLPYDGLIAKSISAIDTQVENIDERITSLNEKLAAEYDILIQQWTQANEALTQLQYLQTTLTNYTSNANS